MFNNNINKPAITVLLPLTSAKTSFCRDGFFHEKKTGFYRSLAKTCQSCTVCLLSVVAVVDNLHISNPLSARRLSSQILLSLTLVHIYFALLTEAHDMEAV